ncbi:GGDEF domain-containing protein [soil metagenome]
MAASINIWWRQPDHFDWFCGYLRARKIVTVSRILVVGIALSLVTIATIVMLSAAGPHGMWPRLLGWAAGAVGCASLWAVRLPTKPQSIAFILALNLCIAVFCHVQSSQYIGLVGCMAFVVTGAYIACFHSAGYLAYNFAVATYLGALQTIRSIRLDDPALAIAGLLLVLVLNVAVPFCIQAVIYVLGVDLLLSAQQVPRYLTISMIDLDRFKQLNDSLGHIAGDHALVEVGRSLRAVTRGRATIGRVGGEEFLVANLVDTEGPAPQSQQLCDAIRALPFPITASVGTAIARVDHLTIAPQAQLVHHLHTQADQAMYVAKHAGGDQIRYAHPQAWPPKTADNQIHRLRVTCCGVVSLADTGKFDGHCAVHRVPHRLGGLDGIDRGFPSDFADRADHADQDREHLTPALRRRRCRIGRR